MKVIMKLIAFLLTMIPFAVLADGEDVTTTVEAFADAINGNVTKNVGNVTVADEYQYASAIGVYATAKDGKTAIVNAKDISANATGVGWQYGVTASAGESLNNTTGIVTITTQNISSKDQGIDARSYKQGSELSINVYGDVKGGVGSSSVTGYYGWGIFAQAVESSRTSIVVSGNVEGLDAGLGIRPSGDLGKGEVVISVDGDVTARDVAIGKGIKYSGTADTSNVIVKGTVTGGMYGIVSNVSDPSYHPDFGVNNLIVWAISAPSYDNLVVKEVSAGSFETDDDYAKKINYIIKHADNVLPKKENGTELDTNFNLPVAKEGDKIIVDTPYDGISINKAFNNGVEITTKDENGNFYVVVERGGGINLTIEADLCPYDPNKLEPGVCGCGMDDVDTDGDGAANCEDVCPEDPLNIANPPLGGCFVNGSNIPERYDPKVETEILANPKTKLLPPFVLRDDNIANVYYERFAGGVFKVGDKKLAKTKYEVMMKTKLKKKKAVTKIVKQPLTKNYRTIKLKKGTTVTLKYRMVITKKVGKKMVTKRTKWSKAEKIEYMEIM